MQTNLERQDRNKYVHLASQVFLRSIIRNRNSYGSNKTFLFYENNICRLVDELLSLEETFRERLDYPDNVNR